MHQVHLAYAVQVEVEFINLRWYLYLYDQIWYLMAYFVLVTTIQAGAATESTSGRGIVILAHTYIHTH